MTRRCQKCGEWEDRPHGVCWNLDHGYPEPDGEHEYATVHQDEKVADYLQDIREASHAREDLTR